MSHPRRGDPVGTTLSPFRDSGIPAAGLPPAGTAALGSLARSLLRPVRLPALDAADDSKDPPMNPAATTDVPRTTAPARAPRLHIRRARPEDMAEVAHLLRSSADWYRELVDPADMAEHDVDEAWGTRNFPMREFFLGEAQGETVGTLSIQEFGDHLYLGYVYLHVSQVGRGFGRQLLLHAEREGVRRRKRGLALLCHPGATWAVKAYRKFGFRPQATSKPAVLAWQGGALEPHYEEGFHLLTRPLAARVRA